MLFTSNPVENSRSSSSSYIRLGRLEKLLFDILMAKFDFSITTPEEESVRKKAPASLTQLNISSSRPTLKNISRLKMELF